jgi:hypothetical protein
MIRTLTAYTREVDEVDAAVAELLEQLDLENRLLKNAVGILAFHPEFLDSGMIEAVGQVLPFATVGYTTPNAAVGGGSGDILFTVAVLTSDEVVFSAGSSVPIVDDPVGPTRELYARIAPPAMGRPALLLAFAPFMENVGGDDFVVAIDTVSGDIPLFGTLAFTHLQDLSGAEICANGVHNANALVLVALFGEVDPHFYISDIPEGEEIRQKALITQAEKNRIQRIDALSPIAYLESIGLAENGVISTGIASFPLVLTLDDGSRIVRVAYKATEEGDLVLGGSTPEGVEVGFADADTNFVVRSAKKATARILAETKTENVLIFSCASRKWVFGAVQEKEMMEIVRTIGDSLSYQFACSGGEICPVRNREGQWVNRFHNFSITACCF